jgi:hypothetical protein
MHLISIGWLLVSLSLLSAREQFLISFYELYLANLMDFKTDPVDLKEAQAINGSLFFYALS